MKRIFAFIDFSDLTRAVIDFAAEQARLQKAELYIIHICPKTVHNFRDFRGILALGSDRLRDNKASELHETLQDLHAKSEEIRSLKIAAKAFLLEEKGNIKQTIIEEAHKHHADLIVLGQHAHSNLYQSFFGPSLADQLAQSAPCPIVILPQQKN